MPQEKVEYLIEIENSIDDKWKWINKILYRIWIFLIELSLHSDVYLEILIKTKNECTFFNKKII